tara:strand:+ start:1863 stop:2165 length:303 start_codon:yes stop_codon:yes gene_type:complete
MKEMKELNKYILIRLNPKSTHDDLIKNSQEAYNVAQDAIDSYVANGFKRSGNDYHCLVSNAVNYRNTDNKNLDIYFELTDDKIEYYLEEIDRINNKDKKK